MTLREIQTEQFVSDPLKGGTFLSIRGKECKITIERTKVSERSEGVAS